MEPYVRTIRDFVEDMFSDGRTANQILAVAAGSRWNTKKDEVLAEILQISKIFKKRFRIPAKNGDNVQ